MNEERELLEKINRLPTSERILEYADLIEQRKDQRFAAIRSAVTDPINILFDVANLRDLSEVISKMKDRQVSKFCQNIAERILPHYEFMFPEDNRPRQALVAACDSISKMKRENSFLQNAIEAARNADAKRWRAASAFCGHVLNPRARTGEEREHASAAKQTAVRAKDHNTIHSESAFIAARAIVYLCQGSGFNSIARSAVFVNRRSRDEEREWQFRHALKILLLGEIPLLPDEIHIAG